MLIILGAGVSVLVQMLKNLTKSENDYATLAIVVVLSLLGATIYYVLTSFNLWESFAAILTIAGAIYTFIIARVETSAPNGTNGVLNIATPESSSVLG